VHHPPTARREAPPTGVIETLSAGYAALNRQLWVLALPVLLNLFLWLGPHVSYSPLVGRIVNTASEWTRQVAFGPRRVVRDPAVIDQLDQSRQWLIAWSDDVNGLTALTWSPIAIPSVAALPAGNDDGLAFVTSWTDGVVLLGACLALGLLAGGWFYGGLAVASTRSRGGPVAAGRGVLKAVLAVLGLVVILSAGAVLLGLPVVLMIGFTAVVSPPVAVLGSLLLVVGLLFATVHLFFAVDAIFISHAGPLLAIQRSVVLVRKHLWHSVALIVLTWLILAGMDRVWGYLASDLQSPYGIILGILGNAYVASGLIAAGMVFYTQRSESLATSAAPSPS
jgi:hypothetical protein